MTAARLAILLAGVCFLLSCARPNGGGAAGFVDVAPVVGVIHATRSGSARKVHIRETLGQGACWIDYNRDGYPDLLVLNGGREVRENYEGAGELLEPWHFYENRRGKFQEISAKVGLNIRAWALGCAVGDIDNDGFDDLFVTTAAGPNRLFHNRRDGTFEDWTDRAGVGDRQLSASAAFGDVNGDGFLDLLVTRYLDESKPPPPEGCLWKGAPVMCGPQGFPPLDAILYLNNGDGTFTDASKKAGISGHPGYGLGVVMFDANGDGYTDIYVANDSTPSHLFLNRGDATFQEAGLAAGVALSDDGTTQSGMGVDSGDLDGDGHPDLIKTNFSDDINNFYRNDGHGFFSDWSQRSGLAAASFHKLGWAVVIEDFDLDGNPDVLVVNGHVYPQVDQHDPNTSYRQELQLFFNDGKGNFREQPERLGPVFRRPIVGRAAAAADFDNDGDMDVLITRDGEPPLLLRNDLPPPSAHWIKVRLEGKKSNRQGIGARVELQCGAKIQVREMRRSRGYLSSGEAVLIFGLGPAAGVDKLSVRWPSGISQTWTGLPGNREIVLTEEAVGFRTPTALGQWEMNKGMPSDRFLRLLLATSLPLSHS